MAKRKQLTLSRSEFYEPLKHLEPDVKHAVIDIILDFFFEDKGICYYNLEPSVRSALACLMPALRRVQTQFDNGKSEKKSRQNSQGLLCPLETSQNMPNLANEKISDSSILNISNNIYNIYNKQTLNEQQAEAQKKEKLYAELHEKIQQLKNEPGIRPDYAPIIRTEDLITRLALETEPQIVNKQPMTISDIFARYLKVFEHKPREVIRNLERIFNFLDTACNEKNITNSYKYLVAIFYNQSLTTLPKGEFEQRIYTEEEMNSLFDNLDEIDYDSL